MLQQDARDAAETPSGGRRAARAGGSGTYAEEIGKVLRRARSARGLTLREAWAKSEGAFKPTSLASYERGERSITVERFCRLAWLYEIPPERLLAEVTRTLEGRPPALVDVSALESLSGAEAAIVSGFVRELRTLREEPATDPISLRSGDLEVLATASGRRSEDFLEAIRPALKTT